MKNSKSLLILIYLVLLAPLKMFSQGNWVEQSVPSVTNKYSWVFATDSSHAYATAFNSKNVMQTFDGGSTWIPYQLSDVNMDLLDVFFLDQNKGWLVGVELTTFTNVMFETSDGGVTWEDKSSNISTMGTIPNCIRYVSPLVGFIGGEFSTGVYKTTDGGLTWLAQSVPWPSGAPLYSQNVLRITTSETGYISMLGISNSSEAFVFTSNDDFNNSISGVYITGSGASIKDNFNVDNTGFVVTSEGIHKSTNSGATWSSVLYITDFSSNLTPQSIWFITPNIGWVAGTGNSTIMKTTDGGNTWVSELSGGQFFRSISMIKSNNNSIHGWAVGNNGVIFKYTDNSDVMNCPTTYSSVDITSCNNYEWSTSGDTYTTTGTYETTLTNSVGCDSIASLNLTIVTINEMLTFNSNTLISNQSGASYQWINCEDNLIISDETNQSFTPNSSGDYAVEITLNNCLETSDCIYVNVLSVKENDIQINIFPNPSNGLVNIQLNSSIDGETIELLDLAGKVQLEERIEFNNAPFEFDIRNLEPGVYIIKIKSNSRSYLTKIIKY